jgi:hypothetical protein
MYGYQCDYCEGTVQPRQVKREAFKHRDGFVILEDVTIGFHALLCRFGLKSVGEFWGEVQGESGHGDCAQRY